MLIKWLLRFLYGNNCIPHHQCTGKLEANSHSGRHSNILCKTFLPLVYCTAHTCHHITVINITHYWLLYLTQIDRYIFRIFTMVYQLPSLAFRLGSIMVVELWLHLSICLNTLFHVIRETFNNPHPGRFQKFPMNTLLKTSFY